MHPDLSKHLHSEECNRLIERLNVCHEENKFRKFLGACNDIDRELNQCLKQEVNFDVGEVNRLNNKVSGKAKKGAQPIRHFSPLCILTCSDGSEYKIKAGIRGKLVEVNEELLTNPQLVNEKPDAEGFLAVVLPNLVESDNLKKLLLSESQYLNIRESGSGGGEM
ncbi:protein Abitram-like isoform X3 [Oratosquilla oratoria]